MSAFDKTDVSETETTKATMHLPGFDIEIVHRWSPDGQAEQISINLLATPSFQAFGRTFEAANPFAFWMQVAQLAWFPWLQAARTTMLPGNPAPPEEDPHR